VFLVKKKRVERSINHSESSKDSGLERGDRGGDPNAVYLFLVFFGGSKKSIPVDPGGRRWTLSGLRGLTLLCRSAMGTWKEGGRMMSEGGGR